MAINLTGLTSTTAAENRGKVGTAPPQGPADRKTSTDSPAPAASETVNLSAQAQTMQRTEEKLAALSDVDEGRVAEIKKAIDEGRYRIDSDAVAGKILDLDESLFG